MGRQVNNAVDLPMLNEDQAGPDKRSGFKRNLLELKFRVQAVGINVQGSSCWN
jgi:hypothetical protein